MEMARTRQDEKIDIVARKGEFMGKTFIDIRQHRKGPGAEVYAKKGLKVPIKICKDIISLTTKAAEAAKEEGREGQGEGKDAYVEIGRIKKDEQVDVVVREREIAGEIFIDLREYVSAGTYRGYTKRGFEAPKSVMLEFMESLRKTWHNAGLGSNNG